jgi:DMSO/TMAO reductase YedYZ molybdopterin-dependent catalytic subunit
MQQMISRELSPLNLEFPFHSLSSEITPNDQFYVRCHFPIPRIDLDSFRLTIEGSVDRDVSFSLSEIRQLPKVTRRVTLECAGNGRIFLVPQVKGAQWEMGAVSTAEWTGTPLSALLELAGVNANALDLIMEGVDQGKAKEPPAPPGEIRYSRSIPIAKALSDVLIAYDMNHEPLSPEHGAPLRAVVPRWFGMASVKWLSRIIVSDRPFRGYFQTTDYAYWKPQHGALVQTPLSEIQIKAQIASPRAREVVPRDASYRVHGAAWGACEVSKVELSLDGGETFQTATLLGEKHAGAWRLWEYHWRTPVKPRSVQLIARAWDSHGRTQPLDRDGNWGTYVICHALPIEITVA